MDRAIEKLMWFEDDEEAKEKGCPFCNGDSNVGNFRLEYNTKLKTVFIHDNVCGLNINYCPLCGRKLRYERIYSKEEMLTALNKIKKLKIL